MGNFLINQKIKKNQKIKEFDSFDYLVVFVVLILCVIRTKQEMELLPCDLKLCHLCQFSIHLP